MHTALYRANALLTHAGTLLAVMCLVTTATDYVHKSDPYVQCSYVGAEGLQREVRHDRAYIVLNLTADLRSEFTWNTKQLFVFVNAEFATRKNQRNQMVMWSAILQEQSQGYLHLPVLRQQYPYAVTDQGFNLRAREFNVSIEWNVMPRVGALYTRRREFSGFRLPDDYHNPSLGKVVRPGSSVAEDLGDAGGESAEALEMDPYTEE